MPWLLCRSLCGDQSHSHVALDSIFLLAHLRPWVWCNKYIILFLSGFAAVRPSIFSYVCHWIISPGDPERSLRKMSSMVPHHQSFESLMTPSICRCVRSVKGVERYQKNICSRYYSWLQRNSLCQRLPIILFVDRLILGHTKHQVLKGTIMLKLKYLKVEAKKKVVNFQWPFSPQF